MSEIFGGWLSYDSGKKKVINKLAGVFFFFMVTGTDFTAYTASL
jgi:hypothetical protein